MHTKTPSGPSTGSGLLRDLALERNIQHAKCFGSFRLLPDQRLLKEGDKPVRIGGRALDLLIALVDRPGELVSKEQLMVLVWPSTIVAPGNLSVHIAALRRSSARAKRASIRAWLRDTRTLMQRRRHSSRHERKLRDLLFGRGESRLAHTHNGQLISDFAWMLPI